EKRIETTRGPIVDRKGLVLAQDDSCVNVCVDYRAITTPPNEDWLKALAERRARERHAEQYKSANSVQRREMLKTETALLKSQITVMWERLAQYSCRSPDDREELRKSRDELDDLRKSIEDRVKVRRRVVWYANYRKVLKDRGQQEDPPWYRKWIMGDQA